MQRPTVEAQPARHLPWVTLLGFGQLAIPLAFASLPVAVYVTRFYAQDMGLGIASVAYVLFLARLADFVIDPVIGYASDKLRWRFGRRRTWILFGAPFFLVGVYMLFSPSPDIARATISVRWFYLLASIAVFYFGWTMITIAYGAWGAELSPDYRERSRITGVREIFTLVGLALSGFIATRIGVPPDKCIPGQVEALGTGGYWGLMEAMGVTIAVLTPIALVLLYVTTPEPPLRETHTTPFWRGVRMAATNWPFVRLFAATALVRMGSRGVEGLLIFYLVSVAMFSQKQASSSILALLIPAVICAPFWIWAGNRFTKHRALAAAMAGGIVVFALLPLISGAGYYTNIVSFAVLGAMFSAPFTLGQSMAADVIDLDSLKSHEPRAGLLISFFQFANKGGDALGIFLSLQFVALLGFTAEKCATNTQSAIHGLEAVYVLFPIATWLPAILLLWNFPITPDIQRRMRALIDKRIKIENSGKLRKLNDKT